MLQKNADVPDDGGVAKAVPVNDATVPNCRQVQTLSTGSNAACR